MLLTATDGYSINERKHTFTETEIKVVKDMLMEELQK